MSDAVNELDDARDVALAKRGDDAAFGRVYDRHAAVVLSICRQSCSSSADAEDALQETFIRAYRKLDKLDEGSMLRPWLYAIARNVCAERRRAAARRAHHEGNAMSNGVAMIEHARRRDADRQGLGVDRERLDELSAALDRLEDRERLAIHLYYLDADPVVAAEAALGVTRSGYYKLLQRAREKLASLMKGAGDGGARGEALRDRGIGNQEPGISPPRRVRP